MFHTFEGFENPTASSTPARGGRERQPSVGRRVTTLRACTSCRHRKIKCDGEKPCEACRWYKKADLCHYSDPRPSRRHVEKLSTTLDEYRAVLEKLFPSTSPEALINMPREKLLELSGKTLSQGQGPVQIAPHPASPATSPVETHISPISNEDGNLESLHTMPEESNDPRSLSAEITNGISDDVNALSLSAKQPSSYLGVSSIHAVLKVIVWLDPGAVAFFSSTPPSGPRRGSIADLSTDGQSWSSHDQPGTPPQVHLHVPESQLIDAYFTQFQPHAPILDEQSFRETYYAGNRKDDRWYCLLNLVLALGAIGASNKDDVSHKIYYSRCRTYLDLESLGSSHLETVQTLGLLGGWYLHYISQPNLAWAIMGAAFRMAAAMGLHREFSDHSESNKQKAASLDIKRRVWWSLFCMDTFGGTTLGRPCFGRFGASITVKVPHHRETGNVLDILPLLENIRFCKIGNQVQDAVALAPLTKYTDLIHFDTQIIDWYNSLPYILKDHEPCPEHIQATRIIMKWRYYQWRMLIYRPTLLSYAMRRVPYIALRSEERTAIEKCRELAEMGIRDIAATVKMTQFNGWNAVWLLFQQTLIPLLGLFLNDNTTTDPRASVESCQAQVEIAMLCLAKLEPWSPTAKKTLDAVSRILEASKRGPVASAAESVPSINTPNSTGRPLNVTPIPPGVLPSQNDFGRGAMPNNEAGFTEPFPAPAMDDSNGQYLWDFLSWTDSNFVPMTDIDTIADATIMDDRNIKYANSGTLFDNQLSSAPYFTNPSIPFYS